MENKDVILTINKILCNALVDRKIMKELKEAMTEDAPFNISYGIKQAIVEDTHVLDNLWSALGAAIGYDLRNLVEVIGEDLDAKEGTRVDSSY